MFHTIYTTWQWLTKEKVEYCMSNCFVSRDEQFYWHGSHNLPERWKLWRVRKRQYYESNVVENRVLIVVNSFFIHCIYNFAMAEQHFDSKEKVENCMSNCFVSRDEQFYWHGIPKLPERWKPWGIHKGQYQRVTRDESYELCS